jgi:hypothetical protein
MIQVYKLWVGIIVLLDLALFLIPVENYFDKYLVLIMITGFALNYFSIVTMGRLMKSSSFGREVGLSIGVLIIVLVSFHQRKSYTFNNNELETIEATVVDFAHTTGWRGPKSYIIKYSFEFENIRYNHQEKVPQAVWANYITKNAVELNVDFVISNPEISRINKSSFTELPNFEKYEKLFY